MKKTRDLIGSIFPLLILLSLTGCSLDRVASQQEQATGLWGELIGGETFGQSFVSEQDNLYKIDLGTATFSRVNSAPVIFHLKDNPGSNNDIRSITLTGTEIQNDRPSSFVFPPISDSAGKMFYFYIESPDASAGNAITVYANENDQYDGGSAYQNGQAVSGDLAFTAYSRESFTISGILKDMQMRASQDIPFFICYGALLVVVLTGIVLAVRKGL